MTFSIVEIVITFVVIWVALIVGIGALMILRTAIREIERKREDEQERY